MPCVTAILPEKKKRSKQVFLFFDSNRVCRVSLPSSRTDTWTGGRQTRGSGRRDRRGVVSYLEILGRVTGELENLGGEVF